MPAVKLDLRTATEFLEDELLPDMQESSCHEATVQLDCKVFGSYFTKTINKSSKTIKIMQLDTQKTENTRLETWQITTGGATFKFEQRYRVLVKKETSKSPYGINLELNKNLQLRLNSICDKIEFNLVTKDACLDFDNVDLEFVTKKRKTYQKVAGLSAKVL